MFKKRFFIWTVLVLLSVIVIAFLGHIFTADADVFKITAEDEGRLDQQFIDRIRSRLGDKNAGRASWELHRFVNGWLNQCGGVEREDLMIDYQNYLERLYQRALKAAMEKMSPGEKAKVLQMEKRWFEESIRLYDYQLKYKDGSLVFGRIPDHFRCMRLYFYRAQYWESSPARRAEIDRFQGLTVRCVIGELSIRYNELLRVTPLVKSDEIVGAKIKTYVESLAAIPPVFCREVRVGKDIYQLGILIPCNDISYERSTHGNERVLTVWKNGKYYALYYLPHHADIQNMKIRGTRVSVKYSQVDEQDSSVRRKTESEQIFTVDFTYHVYAPVKITNWLDYDTDGLGNIHKSGCCRK